MQRLLRFNCFFTPLILILLLSNALYAQTVTELSKGVKVEDMNGAALSFDEIAEEDKGIMIISFWATWCKPCIQELDFLNDMYDELQEDMEVTVYAVSIDDARSSKRVLPFINGKGWEFPVLLDENSLLKRKLNVLNVPHTFIVDRSNKIVYQHTSYVPGDEEEYLEIIEGLNK